MQRREDAGKDWPRRHLYPPGEGFLQINVRYDLKSRYLLGEGSEALHFLAVFFVDALL